MKKRADKPSVYIIGAYQRRLEFRTYADQLEALGYPIASQWLYGPEEDESTMSDADLAHIAEMLESDMIGAHFAIAFTEPEGSPYTRGGRHVEFGFMVACDFGCQRVIVVGRRENLLYHMSIVEQFDTFDQLLNTLPQQGA